MSEAWRDIPGLEGRYLVSDEGRVRCVSTGHLLRLQLSRKGYRYFQARTNGKARNVFVAPALLAAFVSARPFPEAQARHLDGDSQHNSISNLAWGSAADNAADRKRHGRGPDGLRHPQAALTAASLLEARRRIADGDCNRCIARALGVGLKVIANLRAGRTYTEAVGFIDKPEAP